MTKQQKDKKEEELWYVIPELEVRVHQSWINLVQYCRDQIPYGDITIRIVNGQPTELISSNPKVRFDKQSTIPVL